MTSKDDFTFHKNGDEEANSKVITRGNGKQRSCHLNDNMNNKRLGSNNKGKTFNYTCIEISQLS
jgi:hypothetical protein